MRNTLFAFLLLIVASCNRDVWSETSHGVQYKIASFTDDTIRVTSQSVVVIEGAVTDTLHLQTANEAAIELLTNFRLNDSVMIANGARQLGFCHDSATAFRITQVMEPKQWKFMQKFPAIGQKTSAVEQEHMMALVAPYALDSVRLYEGMLLVHQLVGSGNTIQYGQKLTVNFTQLGIDNPVKKQIIFTLGKPDQVVKGFEYGLTQMKVNGKAVFIIPSALAFGTEGASSGVVKPNQPVAFQVHVLAVD